MCLGWRNTHLVPYQVCPRLYHTGMSITNASTKPGMSISNANTVYQVAKFIRAKPGMSLPWLVSYRYVNFHSLSSNTDIEPYQVLVLVLVSCTQNLFVPLISLIYHVLRIPGMLMHQAGNARL